jgi:outer membrane protein
MKNRLTVFAAVLAVLAFSHVSRAQSKVAVININAAIANSAEGKKAIADLQKKYQPRQQELERLQQEIQTIQDKLTKQGPSLSEDEQRRLGRDLEDKQKQLKRSTDDAQADFTADRDETIKKIGQKMLKTISDYAQQNGLTLVMDDAQIPVYYVAKDLDITEEIVKRFDAANPVSATGTPAAKPATKSAAPTPASKPR